MRYTPWICLLLSATGPVGCSASKGGRGAAVGRTEGAARNETDPPDTSGLVFNLRFDAGADERGAIVRALGVAAGLPNGPDLRTRAFPAEVYRFGPAVGRRYVVLAYQPRFTAGDGDHWGASFYVLQASRGDSLLSRPLDMKDAEYVTLEEVRDVDGDGALDIVYCKGYEGEEEAPRRLYAP